MSKLSKLTRSALNIKKHEMLFKCPICQSPIRVKDLKSLICTHNHTFDIAKQGYVNLVTNNTPTNYDKSLFEARREIIEKSGLYDYFNEKVTKIIDVQTVSKSDLLVIDMGSGEGSHLNRICSTLHSQYQKSITGIGIDISKDATLAATKNYEDIIWLVADLANTPFANGNFDVIINILSPSNYEEFSKILKDDGFIVKVVPRKDYLKELRGFFYKESDKENYSNSKIIDHFKNNFHLIDQTAVHYTKMLDKSALSALVKMTPLTWGIDDKLINQFLTKGTQKITIDLDILIGKKQG